jgi:hypothetical protein
MKLTGFVVIKRISPAPWLTRMLTGLCMIVALVCSAPAIFAQTINGPDNQPLPGSQGGLSIPDPPPPLDPPALGGIENEAKKDMEKHPGQEKGSVKKGKATIEWRRTGENSWTFTVTIEGANMAPLSGSVVTDASGVSHAKLTVPTGPDDKRRTYGPTYIFSASAANCTKLVSIQYIQRVDTLLDGSGKTIQTSKLGPGIDGGVPYPVQGDVGGSNMIQDTPGISGPANASDQQLANGDMESLRRELNVPKAGVSGRREFKYWSYVICLAPKYEVIGHWSWGFTIVIDPQNPPHLSQTGVQEPTWTPNK